MNSDRVLGTNTELIKEQTTDEGRQMPTGGTPIQFATFTEFRGIFQETASTVLQLGASDVLGWDTKRI